MGTLAPASNLTKMRFDKDHYTTAYTLCKGRGLSDAACKQRLLPDLNVTPSNPLPVAFKKETIDAMECMSDHGDLGKCNHFFESFHKKIEPAAHPEVKSGFIASLPTKGMQFLGLLGGSTIPFLAVCAGLRVVKIRI